MLQLSQQIIQLPVLLQPSTLTYSPSMKIAESGSDLLIFSWPSLSPASIWCEITTGLNFFFLAPAYSLWRKGGKGSGAKQEPWDIHILYTFNIETNTVHKHNIYIYYCHYYYYYYYYYYIHTYIAHLPGEHVDLALVHA